MEEPIFEDVAEPILRQVQADGVTIAVPILPRGDSDEDNTHSQRELLDTFLDGRDDPQVLWYYTPMALAFTSHIAAKLVIYDNMDELTAFRGASPNLMRNEKALFARAKLVFTGGTSLYEAKKHQHANIHPFPSSVDTRHYSAARNSRLSQPNDQSQIPGPRLGYFGVIDERIDLDLLEALASLRPDWQFVMVGPVAKIDPSTLPQRTNIHWMGIRSYNELPAYLAGWDVGLMPFALNEATRFISPTKTPEFLAAGVPVVSTPIRDVVRPYGDLGLVRIAETADEFAECAAAAMKETPQSWLAEVDLFLAQGSWDATWEAMHALMDAELSSAALSGEFGSRKAESFRASLAAAE